MSKYGPSHRFQGAISFWGEGTMWLTAEASEDLS